MIDPEDRKDFAAVVAEINRSEQCTRYYDHPAAPTLVNKYQVECLAKNLHYLFCPEDVAHIIDDHRTIARVHNVVAEMYSDIQKVPIQDVPETSASGYWAEAIELDEAMEC